MNHDWDLNNFGNSFTKTYSKQVQKQPWPSIPILIFLCNDNWINKQDVVEKISTVEEVTKMTSTFRLFFVFNHNSKREFQEKPKENFQHNRKPLFCTHNSLILSFHCPPIVSQLLWWWRMTSLNLYYTLRVSSCVLFLLSFYYIFKNGRQSKFCWIQFCEPTTCCTIQWNKWKLSISFHLRQFW